MSQESFFDTEWMPVMGAGSLNLSFAWEIAGDLNIEALSESVRAVAYRHDALRVRFVLDDSGVHQCVTSRVGYLRTLDLSHLEAAEARVEAQLIGQEEAVTPFELSIGPLYRTLLLILGTHSYMLVCVFHHIIFDGNSFSIWQREVTAAYRHLTTGLRPTMQPAPVYSVIVAKQREQAIGNRPYWASLLARVSPWLDLPVAHRDPVNVWRNEVVPVAVSPRAFARVVDLCREVRITRFACILAAFAMPFSRLVKQEKVALGFVFAGRLSPGARNAIGLFRTVLYARVDHGGNPSLAEFLRRVQVAVNNALRHDPCPADLMPRTGDIPGINYFPQGPPSTGNSESFLGDVLETARLECAPRLDVLTPSAGTEGSISLVLSETEKGLVGGLGYNFGRYQRSEVERFSRRFEFLLRSMPDYRDARIDEIWARVTECSS